MRTIINLFGAALIVLGLGASTPALAQNRNLMMLHAPSTSVEFTPDEFSRFDLGGVMIGRFQTYYYSGFELGLRASVPKSGGPILYTAYAVAPRLRSPGRIISMSARGEGPMEEFSQYEGDANCGGASCRNTAVADFSLSEAIQAKLRKGEPVDVRVSTTCGSICDVVLPLEPGLFAMLENWANALPSRKPGQNQPAS